MRIIIADDHIIVRRGLQLILTRRPAWTIAAEAESADQLFAALRRDTFDVIVLDFTLPDRDGIAVLTDLRREFPHIPVLVLSMHPEEHYALRAIRAGARGYVQKDATADEIIDAIERVATGRTYLSAVVADQLAAEMASPPDKLPHERLSGRESEVFRLLASGRSITEIAGTLSVSVKTASTYRARILEKTGLRTNADIVAYAIREHLI